MNTAASSASDHSPRLTIGLAVYNNGQTLRRAVESLLAQTFTDFSLLISDDRSSDDSLAIAYSLAAADPRIEVVAQQENRNYGNFRWLVHQARTPYFMFAAADDWWHPSYVATCVDALEANARAVLATSKVRFDGTEDLAPGAGTYALRGSPTQNLATYLRAPLDNSRMYGVIRTDVAQRAFPRTDHHAYDWTFSAASLREGEHLEIDQVLMVREYTPTNRYVTYVERDNPRFVDRLFPLFPMTRALLFEKRIPRNIRVIRSLLRINLEHHIAMLNYRRFRFGRLSLLVSSRLVRYL